jgi:hypothetical protein
MYQQGNVNPKAGTRRYVWMSISDKGYAEEKCRKTPQDAERTRQQKKKKKKKNQRIEK